MAFAKARIQRFNELENDVPAPGAYDQKLKDDSQQHLADLQVECSNTAETKDMKEEVQKLESQLEELFKKHSQMEEQHKKDMEAMPELQQEVLNGHDEKYQGEMGNLHWKLLEGYRKLIKKMKVVFENEKATIVNEYKSETVQKLEIQTKANEAAELNSFLKTELQNVQRLYKDVSNRLSEAHQKLDESEKKYNLAVKKHTDDLADIMKRREVEKTRFNYQLEVAKGDYLKKIKNLTAEKIEEFAACRAEINERVNKIIRENEAKVNAMIREAKAAKEEKMRMTAACLARLETKAVELNEKLSQLDAEITSHSITFEQLRSSLETLVEKNNHLENKAELYAQERRKWITSEKTVREELERERSLRETLEVENKNLAKNYEEINEKYAELVGHYNPKQKIKHLSQLKDKIVQLEQDVRHKARIIKHQQKTIDKLTAEDMKEEVQKLESQLEELFKKNNH